jgi:hypothetical protein
MKQKHQYHKHHDKIMSSADYYDESRLISDIKYLFNTHQNYRLSDERVINIINVFNLINAKFEHIYYHSSNSKWYMFIRAILDKLDSYPNELATLPPGKKISYEVCERFYFTVKESHTIMIRCLRNKPGIGDENDELEYEDFVAKPLT